LAGRADSFAADSRYTRFLITRVLFRASNLIFKYNLHLSLGCAIPIRKH
jgi:hypothetical protein